MNLEELCENIDASVFSGDLLWLHCQRTTLKEYVGRWQRAIAQHEANENFIDKSDEAEDK